MDNVKQWTGLSLYQSCSTQHKTGTLKGKEEGDAMKKKQWMDNVKQWTGLSLPVLLHTAQDRDIEVKRRRGKKKRTSEEAADGQRHAVDRPESCSTQHKTGTLKGKEEGERRRGHQKKQRMDNVMQWTGLSPAPHSTRQEH